MDDKDWISRRILNAAADGQLRTRGWPDYLSIVTPRRVESSIRGEFAQRLMEAGYLTADLAITSAGLARIGRGPKPEPTVPEAAAAFNRARETLERALLVRVTGRVRAVYPDATELRVSTSLAWDGPTMSLLAVHDENGKLLRACVVPSETDPTFEELADKIDGDLLWLARLFPDRELQQVELVDGVGPAPDEDPR
jgi:hypothetical protein